MNVLEILLSRRWILKSKDRELYYQVKDEVSKVKKFINEKLGYQLIVNPYLIKLEKTPAVSENWMGISEFQHKIEYVFLCMILMFLEDKEAEEQFVLSELTEYIQSQYKEESIDWTLYQYRRHLIKVIKFCETCGMIVVNDGNEESFAKNDTNEVLYENTGVSRYFMKNFTQDIMGCESPKDFEREEWLDMNEDRGIVRRHRVYRSLLMSPALYKTEENEEDFLYIRNYRNTIGGDFSDLFDCELQIHKTSAFLVLGPESRLGRSFPEGNTLSDIVLLCNGIFREEIQKQKISVAVDESVLLSKQQFQEMIERCKSEYGKGFAKTYRDMSNMEFYHTVKDYMKEMEFIEERMDSICIRSIMGKVIGNYPKDFVIGAKEDE
ncbi:MAG TPA: TIGR02678 family protein [Candidatus Scybalomonas excrementigallinarum]|nr:TIGR02678 family protein [Candidatus Scybalomonas excrementigallinarum]